MTEVPAEPLAAPPHEDARGPAVAAATVVLLAIAVGATGLRGAFLFDDMGSIVENASIRTLSPLAPALEGVSATTVGRPVLNLTFALSYAAGGLDVLPWHVVNVAIHALAGLALFGVARRTLLSRVVPEALSRRATGLAGAIAALWAVHPLQTESVTYLCQRAESLAGLLILATLYAALRGASAASPGRARAWTAAAVVCCALAAGTKETAAAAPLLVLLHDRTFAAGSFRGALRARPGLYAGLAATWVLGGALLLSSGGRAGSAGFGRGVGAIEYAATQTGVVVEMLRLCLWPDPLVLDRGARLATSAAEVVAPALAVALLVAVTVRALVRRPAAGFLGAWLLVLLAPTSSFVPLVTQTAAEHRMYLPLAAVVAAVVLGAHALLAKVLRGNAASVAGTALVAGAVAALGARTCVRNATYEDPRAIWQEVVAWDPSNPRGWMNLGISHAADGDLEGGLRCLDRAVAADPGNAYARILRGNLRHEAGDDDGALGDYTAAAASPARAARALTNRAVLLLARGDAESALRDLDRVLGTAPQFADARLARAAAHLLRKDYDRAWEDVGAAKRAGRSPSSAWMEKLVQASGRSE